MLNLPGELTRSGLSLEERAELALKTETYRDWGQGVLDGLKDVEASTNADRNILMYDTGFITGLRARIHRLDAQLVKHRWNAMPWYRKIFKFFDL